VIWIALAVATAIGLAFLILRVAKGWRIVRGDIRRLAGREINIAERQPDSWPFAKTRADLLLIAGHLRQLDRQVADEGLSLRTILSSMKEGILIVNRDHRITLVNEALGSFFPDMKSPLGRPVLEAFRRHELEQAISQILAGGRRQRLEMSFPQPAPALPRQFDIHVAPLSAEQGSPPQAVLAVFQDVTEVRTLEVARREFVANVSHEFRTPLTIINGYVETLLDGTDDEPEMAGHSLSAIHRNVQRLALLIDDLLTISQIEGRARILECRDADLHRVLRAVLENFAPDIEGRGAEVFVDWNEDARRIEADPRRMEQVFSNLLENALRYTENARPRIAVRGELDGGDVVVSISDNGPGIPFEDQAHIFERFYRVGKDRARGAGGTGLGLSIVKNIVLAHGGAVHLDSTPGSGATFRIRLPVRQNAVPNGK
jgi:two-component system phosphate regulon sensor histidine kinase PhoR